MSGKLSICRTHTVRADAEMKVIKLNSEFQEKYIYCYTRTGTLPAVLLKI
jgi:hypothetical protein